MKNWLFKLLFPRECEHMSELVDDVIRLEEKLKKARDSASYSTSYETGSNNTTQSAKP